MVDGPCRGAIALAGGRFQFLAIDDREMAPVIGNQPGLLAGFARFVSWLFARRRDPQAALKLATNSPAGEPKTQALGPSVARFRIGTRRPCGSDGIRRFSATIRVRQLGLGPNRQKVYDRSSTPRS